MFARFAWQGSWWSSAHGWLTLFLGPQRHPCSLAFLPNPCSPLSGIPTFFAAHLPRSWRAPISLENWYPAPPALGPQGSKPHPQALRGLTLTVTAGLGRSSQAGPGSPHTGQCLWSRSSSEDTSPLGVSRPHPPLLPPAAAGPEPPLPFPHPHRGPSLLGPPHSSAQAGATTSPRPGDPPSRQLARSALASLSPLSPFQSVLPVSLWCPIFCLFLFCLCASLVFLTQ